MLKAIELFGRNVDGCGNWPYSSDRACKSNPEYSYGCQLRGKHECQDMDLYTYQTHVDDTMDLCATGLLVLRYVVKRDGGYYHFPALTEEQKQFALDWLHAEEGARWVAETEDYCELAEETEGQDL